jgi:ArsR family transcriptional regulator
MSDYCYGPPVLEEGAARLEFSSDDEFAVVAHALAHPVRLRIVRLLARREACTGADLFPEIELAQSTVSEHLRVLKDAGIVVATPNGNRMCYGLASAALVRLGRGVTDLLGSAESTRSDMTEGTTDG